MSDLFVNWLANLLGYATPYALAALGMIVCERAGVLNLSAEGMMLIGALAGIASCLTFGGYPLASFVVAAAATAAVSTIFAAMTVLMRIEQVIAGLSMAFFCQGLTALLGTLFGWKNLPIAGIGKIDIPVLSDIPLLGRILFSQDAIAFLVIPAFFACSAVFNRTLLGLRLRAVGENPEAADAAGIDVTAYRFAAVLAGSALAGVAGAYIAVAGTKLWIDGETAGRGWIAIALVIFARWRPWRALFGAFLFGTIESAAPRLAAAGIKVPQYFILMMPYIATLGVMVVAGLSARRGQSDQPGALGIPHLREERR